MTFGSEDNSERGLWAWALFVAVITFVVFLPSVNAAFVSFDDDLYIYNNLLIRRFDASMIVSAFTEVVAGNWHPLTIISHALDHALFGLDPRGHHLMSVMIHSFNTFLVFLLTRRLYDEAARSGSLGIYSLSTTGALVTPIVTALLFGLHPLRVESVVWVSERKDLLCAFFYLLGLLSYLKYTTGRRGCGPYYIVALFTLLLALLSKPMAVSFPIVLIILDFYPLGRFGSSKGAWAFRRTLFEKIPFFLLAAAASAVTMLAQSSAHAIATDPLATRLLVAARAYIFYLVKTLWPSGLAPIYPYPVDPKLFSFEYLGSIALILFFTVMAVVMARRSGLFTALWAYYLVTLAPVIGIIQVGSQAAADRYTYLPGIAPLLLVGLIISFLYSGLRKPGARILLVALLSSMMALLSFLTIKQGRVWRDSLSLWSHQIKIYPNRIPGPYNDRGNIFRKAGLYDEALSDFNTSIAINPTKAMTYNNRGLTYRYMGDHDRAMADFNEAIRVEPDYALAYNNRGLEFMDKGKYKLALADFERALSLDPSLVLGANNIGIIYFKEGKYKKAEEAFRRALLINPYYAGAYMNLGILYLNTGDRSGANAALARAAELGDKKAVKILEDISKKDKR